MGTKPPVKNGHVENNESEYQSSPCVTHSRKGYHIRKCLLYKAICDNFDLHEDIGSLEKLTNQIWCKTNKKRLIEKKITHAM